MDAIVGVWLTSIVGAGAFAAAGYVVGQRGVVLPFLRLAERPHDPVPPATVRTPEAPQPDRPKTPDPAPVRHAAEPLKTPAVPIVAGAGGFGSEAPTTPGLERPTLVPEKTSAREGSVPTIPPARVPSLATAGPTATEASLAAKAALAVAELEETRNALRHATDRATKANERARAAEVVRAELEKQIERLRADLRAEVAGRATAVAEAEQLGDRLAGASGEAASLRHRVATLDKQVRQLKDEVQGRVRALTTSESARRRNLEDAEEMRVRLRDVYDKIEQTSLPPGSNPPRGSVPPVYATARVSAVPRDGQAGRLTGIGDDAAALRREVARLSAENRTLRERALGTLTPKRTSSRDSVPDVDLDAYRSIIERARSVAGLRGIVIADEIGNVLVGSGDLSDSLAAFGAYIRDASTRTDRLLPLETVEQIDIRDRTGMILCTRVISHPPTEISLVVLGVADSTIAGAKKIAEDTLRIR